jgi:hypothetical protein
MGVADGLFSLAVDEKRRERQAAREADRVQEEKRLRHNELNSLDNALIPAGENANDEARRAFNLASYADDNRNSTDVSYHTSDVSSDGEFERSDEHPEPDFKTEDNDSFDLSDDVDMEIQRLTMQKDMTKKTLDRSGHNGVDYVNYHRNSWKSEMQLVRFRQSADKVADDFLKQQSIKLYSGGSTRTSTRDVGSYDQGKRDSQYIDVYQRRLT